MGSVIVQRPAEPGGPVPQSWSLGPGESLRFGRAGPDVPLEDPGVPRLAGEITAAEDYWLLSSFARDRTYVVENPQGGGEFVKVAPGRSRAPVPFEFSRLLVPVAGGSVDLLVFAPEHGYLDAAAPAPGAAGEEATIGSFCIDESARYFLVLVALCEPRLRDPASVAIPSDAAVARRLAELGDEAATPDAVGFHVGYLAEHKLHLREREGGDAELAGGRLAHRREALVAVALRFDVVREEHLRLLAGTS